MQIIFFHSLAHFSSLQLFTTPEDSTISFNSLLLTFTLQFPSTTIHILCHTKKYFMWLQEALLPPFHVFGYISTCHIVLFTVQYLFDGYLSLVFNENCSQTSQLLARCLKRPSVFIIQDSEFSKFNLIELWWIWSISNTVQYKTKTTYMATYQVVSENTEHCWYLCSYSCAFSYHHMVSLLSHRSVTCLGVNRCICCLWWRHWLFHELYLNTIKPE